MSELFSETSMTLSSNYTEMVFWVVVLLIVLVFGCWFIGKIRAWSKSSEEDPRQTPQTMLTTLREAYERGDLEEEEYLKVKERLTQAIRDMYLNEGK